MSTSMDGGGNTAIVTWSLSGHGFSVHMPRELAGNLEGKILAGSSARASGAERAAGILTGRRAANGDAYIDGAVPSCGRPLPDVLAEVREGGRQPLGYYRHHEGEVLELEDEDLMAIRAWFTSPDSLILLLKPTREGRVQAGFFFWVDDTLVNELLHPPLPFPSAWMETGEVEQRSVPPRPAVRAASPAQATKPWLPGISRGARAAGVTAATVLLLVAGAVGISRVREQKTAQARTAPAAVPQPLGMRVEQQANWLRVSWDRNSPLVVNAHSAVIEVKEGDFGERIYLDPLQLKAGTVIYQPRTSDISLRLTVFRGQAAPAAEVVRIVGYTPAFDPLLPPPPVIAGAVSRDKPAAETGVLGRVARREPRQAARNRRRAPLGPVEAGPRKFIEPPPSEVAQAEPLSLPAPAAFPQSRVPSDIRITSSPPQPPSPPAAEPAVQERSPLRALGSGLARAGRGIGRFLAGTEEETKLVPGEGSSSARQRQ